MLRGRLIPWPWTLNVAGTPQRYATRAEACAGLRRALARTPANRIDAGLGQVNLGYHTHRYTQPCELLDPYRNLAIAAEILREQHTPGEDWLLAIGRYHRPAGGAPAARYRRSVHRHLTRVPTPAFPFQPSRPPRHEPHRPHRGHRAAVHDHRLRPDRLRAADRRRRPRRRPPRCRTTSR